MSAAINEKNVPGVDVPMMTLYPPYQIIAVIPRPPNSSMTGEDIDLTIAFLISYLNNRLVFSKKRLFSYDSIPKAFTILPPVRVSWRRKLISAMASWHRVLNLRIRLPNFTMGITATGKIVTAIKASTQSR